MGIDSILIRAWHDVLNRADGPMNFRLIIQPVMAIIFAVRSGLKDARKGRAPFLLNIFVNREHRKHLLLHGFKDVGKIFIMAAVIDVVYQLMVFKHIYPLETLVVAVVLSIVPYVLVRGPVNRLAKFVQQRKTST